MPDVRGQAVAMALLALTAGLGSLAEVSKGTPTEPHAPIKIDGDLELQTNACACVRNPGAAGTPSDPYVIEEWRVTATGTAIEIRDISETHFVLRDNLVEGQWGIRLVNTGDRGAIVENTVNFEGTGIQLVDSSPRVSENVVQSVSHDWVSGTRGVTIDGGAPHLDGNEVSFADYGVLAMSSSPVLEDNHVSGVDDGIHLTASTHARLVDNNVTLAERTGVYVTDSAEARLIGNEIREGQAGIVAENAHLYMQGNKVSNQKADAIRFDRSTVEMFRNDISNNWRGAFGSTNSDVVIRENVFRDNGDADGPNDNAGLRLDGSEGRVVNNTVVGNDVGIRLDHSIITLEDNNLSDNKWGISIPYNSKGTIPLMSGNVVNGINVDGTIDEDEQRIFYEEVNVTIENETIDSGHGDDLYGTLFKQGALVVYDSQDVTIRNNSFVYNDVGVRVQDSSFVRVQANAFVSNHEAVVSVDSRIFIKENVCEIEIDPPETVCFRVDGGFAIVRANLAAHVSVGIHFTGKARGEIVDNTVRSNVEAGVHVEGHHDQSEHDVIVIENHVEGNLVGVLATNFQGQIEANTIEANTEAAVHVETRTNATFTANTIVDNGAGIVDLNECPSRFRTRCSTSVFVDNTIEANAGVGVHLENGASFEGDLLADNEIGARIEGETTMTGVNATRNAKAGVVVDGSLAIEDSNASDNGGHGVRVTGLLVAEEVNVSANGAHGLHVTGEADVEDANASANDETGIRVEGRANLETVVAFENDEDGAELVGEAEVSEANFSANGEAGLRLGGTLFVVEDCEASFNTDGVVMVEGSVEIDIRPPVPRPPTIGVPDVPDLPDGDDEEESDPLWMHECNLVGNEDHALRANVEAMVNATHNFWGKEGPVVDAPLLPGDNVVSANAIVTPFYETREHEIVCTVPATEAGADKPQGCVDP